jgi:hypothetical protein
MFKEEVETMGDDYEVGNQPLINNQQPQDES